MFENFDNFIYSSKENFPKDVCTIQNKCEPKVFDSNKIYQVLYIDIRFPSDKNIKYAKPYIFKEDGGKVSFGWESTSSSEIFGNVENSCQFYDEFVVGFIPVDDEFITEDKALFEKYKATIEVQEGWL